MIEGLIDELEAAQDASGVDATKGAQKDA